MEERLEKYRQYFLKLYNLNRKKLYPLLKSMTDEEKNIVLSDEQVIENIMKIEDSEILDLIFRMSPASVQEIIWKNDKCQKILLGIKKLDLTDIKALNKSIYFSKERLRRIQIFISEIKSQNILDDLVNNIYFQIIVLFSKGLHKTVLASIDCYKLYDSTISSGIYELANYSNKRRWVSLLNCEFEKIKLPKDYVQVFKEQSNSRVGYYYIDDSPIVSMLRSKCYHMKEAGKKVIFDKKLLDVLSIKDISSIYSMAEKDYSGILDGVDNIKDYLVEIVNKRLVNGTAFDKDFLDLTSINNPFQYLVFTTIKEKSDTDLDLRKKFTSFLRNYLFKGEYNEEEYRVIDVYIENSVLNCDKNTLSTLFGNHSDLKSLFHLKFNQVSYSMNYLDGIDAHTIFKLNVKQINKIAKLLEDKTQDELSDTYSKAIRMYFVFGLDRSLSILSGTYGKVSKAFLDCVSKLDIENIALKQVGKKYEPVLNQEFINFLFTGDNIFELFTSGSTFETTWFHLFNDFIDIKETCKGHITLKQAEIVLKEKMKNVKYTVEPDLYPLEDYLYEIGLGNKTKKSNEEVYDEVVRVYRQQQERKVSTIPYVSGVSLNGYRYEVMRMDDVLAYVLGYRAGCCIRILDIAHNHLLHALLCENGRILLTYSPKGVLTSFSPLKRNGELLIANSIEAIEDKSQNVVMAFTSGIRAIMNETRMREEMGYLKVACIGSEAYLKPEGKEWPQSLPTPTILEKNDEVYGRTDQYHKKLDVIMMEDGFDLRNLKLGKVEAEYRDSRKPIKSCKFSDDAVSIEKIEVAKIVNAINYKNADDEMKKRFYKTNIYYMDYAFYNEDWYILIDKSGKFHSGVIKDSSEALKEMQATLAVISEISKKKDMDEYVLSFKNRSLN